MRYAICQITKWENINGYSDMEMSYFKETDSGKCTLDYGVFTRGRNSECRKFLGLDAYIVYFWSNENEPLEPVHVHIAEGRATSNATKVWITSTGKALLSHNSSKYQPKFLNSMIRVIEANSEEIIEKWLSHFGEIRYFC